MHRQQAAAAWGPGCSSHTSCSSVRQAAERAVTRGNRDTVDVWDVKHADTDNPDVLGAGGSCGLPGDVVLAGPAETADTAACRLDVLEAPR